MRGWLDYDLATLVDLDINRGGMKLEHRCERTEPARAVTVFGGRPLGGRTVMPLVLRTLPVLYACIAHVMRTRRVMDSCERRGSEDPHREEKNA